MMNSEPGKSVYSAASLLDIHERTHRSFAVLLTHCLQFSENEVSREISGFGYASIRLQLHHVVGAERYWLGVLQGIMDADDDADQFPTIASLETLRKEVAAKTANYLREVSADDLNCERPMKTWGDREPVLNPANVIMRTQAHCFHHLGQVSAMCRLLGKPSPGCDYAID